MSPTRRDILKLSAGVVATALTASAVGSRIAESVTAAPEPEYVTWEMTAPVMLDASDGRRICFLPQEAHTLVNIYPDRGSLDHESIWIEGEESARLYGMMSAIATGVAMRLEEQPAQCRKTRGGITDGQPEARHAHPVPHHRHSRRCSEVHR